MIGGLREEFVFGARLDNLVGSFTAIDGLLESLKDEASVAKDPNIRIVACFDNEEVKKFCNNVLQYCNH